MFPTNNRIPENVRSMCVDILNQLLADTSDLWSQSKHAHWNVVDERFFMLHELFDRIADPLPGFVDDIAERITALGGYAKGTTRMASTFSRLPEVSPTDSGFLTHLINLFATHGENLRTAIRMCCEMEYEDEVTSNMLQEQSHEIDKLLYFLERHVDTDNDGD